MSRHVVGGRWRWRGALLALVLAGVPTVADAEPRVNYTVSDRPAPPPNGDALPPADGPAPQPVAAPVANESERWVFLVHGILMSKRSMAYLEERLAAAGFRVVNRSYASTRLTIQESADFLRRRVERRRALNPNMEVNLVTHSMGGLVARYYLTHTPPPRFGALVQIAPPNLGSEKATQFKNFFFYRWVYKRTGQQLVTGLTELQQELGTPHVPLGIIAGGTGDDAGFSPAIDGDDDGTISVANTRLSTMTDHIVLRHSHAFIMKKRETADQVIAFLERGRFRRAADETENDRTLVAID